MSWLTSRLRCLPRSYIMRTHLSRFAAWYLLCCWTSKRAKTGYTPTDCFVPCSCTGSFKS